MLRTAQNSLLLLICLFCVFSGLNLLGCRWQEEGSSTEAAEIGTPQARKQPANPEKTRSEQADAQAILNEARAALKKGDRHLALSLLTRLSDRDGASHFAAGVMLVEEKVYAAAAREFGLARRTYSDRYIAGYDQALAYLNAGDYSSAIQTANELLSQGYQTAELADVAATAYLRGGSSKEAYNAFRLATHLDPKDEEAYLGLCEIALARDNYDLGMDVANIGISHLPNSERLLVERGVMHAMKGESAQAELDFTAARKLAPLDALPVVSAALVSMQNGRLDHAIDLLRQAAKQQPESYFAQYWFAEALLRAGALPGTPEGEEALRALRLSVRNNAGFWHARAELGKMLLSSGDVDDAIQQLEKAAELNPKATSPLYLLAQAYRRKGNEAKAAELESRVSTLQAEERRAQTIPQAPLKQLLEGETARPSTREENH